MLLQYVRVINTSDMNRVIRDRELSGGRIVLEPGQTFDLPRAVFTRSLRWLGASGILRADDQTEASSLQNQLEEAQKALDDMSELYNGILAEIRQVVGVEGDISVPNLLTELRRLKALEETTEVHEGTEATVSGAHAGDPTAQEAAGNPAFICDECGQVCKSALGLGSHKRTHKKA